MVTATPSWIWLSIVLFISTLFFIDFVKYRGSPILEILNFELIKFSRETGQEFLSIIIFFIFNLFKKFSICPSLKKEILKPTKIYTNEILKLVDKELINAAAHITGGGLIENLLRSIPTNLSLNLNLSKIKVIKIFKWLKSKNISDNEMMRTFNCGVGFCIISPRENIKKFKNTLLKNTILMK